VLVLLVLAVVLGAQLSELLDTWDNTPQTGNDVEFSLTLLALCVGMCLLFVKLLLGFFTNPALRIHRSLLRGSHMLSAAREVGRFIFPLSPPLRV
jgi:hypothetical protein